jgi:hypothetical protein
MNTLKVCTALLALALTMPAHGKDSPEDAALKTEWKATGGFLILALPGLTLEQAHQRTIADLASDGSEILSERPEQIVADLNVSQTNPGWATGMSVLAGDPHGGAWIKHRVITFTQSGEALQVRWCASFGQQNRFGAFVATKDCRLTFKEWKTARARVMGVLADPQPIAVAGVEGEVRP